eukprot:3303640-Rhodomonas_salina.2
MSSLQLCLELARQSKCTKTCCSEHGRMAVTAVEQMSSRSPEAAARKEAAGGALEDLDEFAKGRCFLLLLLRCDEEVQGRHLAERLPRSDPALPPPRLTSRTPTVWQTVTCMVQLHHNVMGRKPVEESKAVTSESESRIRMLRVGIPCRRSSVRAVAWTQGMHGNTQSTSDLAPAPAPGLPLRQPILVLA